MANSNAIIRHVTGEQFDLCSALLQGVSLRTERMLNTDLTERTIYKLYDETTDKVDTASDYSGIIIEDLIQRDVLVPNEDGLLGHETDYILRDDIRLICDDVVLRKDADSWSILYRL